MRKVMKIKYLVLIAYIALAGSAFAALF